MEVDDMATMEEKKLRQLRLFNDIIYGFAHGLYDLFGESAMATVDSIGEQILEDMEHELGLEIAGETPEDILLEIERLMVDEYGLCKSATLEMEDDEIDVICEGCLMWRATNQLREEGIPPYTCIPMMMASAALHKRLGVKAKFVSVEQDFDKRLCDIDFHLME
jgi:hypothetical protein